MKLTRAYVRKLYNRFQATLVPSENLAGVLVEWGVRNVRTVQLGVNTDVFKPTPDDGKATRASLASLASKSCFSTSAVWPGKRTRKHFFELSNSCSGGVQVNFIC